MPAGGPGLKRVSLILCILAVLACIGCTTASESKSPRPRPPHPESAIDSEIAALLDQYSLETSGAPTQLALTPEPVSPGSEIDEWLSPLDDEYLALAIECSKQIGLDPSPWQDCGLTARQYALKRESLGGPVWVHFLIAERHVVGAHLSLEGYAPGIEPLSWRVPYMPPGLSSTKLAFEGVANVQVSRYGSIGVVIPSSLGTSAILEDLAASEHRVGHPVFPNGEPKYTIIVHYLDGTDIEFTLVDHEDEGPLSVQAPYGMLLGQEFVPPASLEKRILDLIEQS